MPTPFWTLEPEGTPVVLVPPAYELMEFKVSPPQPQAQYVGNSDSDGDSLYATRIPNRTVSLSKLRVEGSGSAVSLETRMAALQAVVGKINLSAVGNNGIGGTLQYTSPSGAVAIWDVCTASIDGDLDLVYAVKHWVIVSLEFGVKPFWRGVEAEV